MPEALRAVFFDAGNTLVYPRIEEVAEDLTKHGYPAPVEDFYAAERAGKHKLDEWLWPQISDGKVPRTVDAIYWGEYLRVLMDRVGVPEAARGSVMLRVGEKFRDLRVWSKVFPDTAACLTSLRAEGYYLGVISNSVGTIEEQLNRVGLGKYFDTILDSAIVGVEKPHPEIFQLALERAGAKAAEAAFIGDTYATDVGGAQLAGLRGILIDRVGAYPNARCPRIMSLSALPPVLENYASY